jgi:hypothetical protein
MEVQKARRCPHIPVRTLRFSIQSQNKSEGGDGRKANPHRKIGRRPPVAPGADEGEAAAEFEKQIAQMSEQTSLQLPLLERVGQGKEIEVVGIAQDLLRQVRLARSDLGGGRVRWKLESAFPSLSCSAVEI